jgi:CPA2 family monovalent cation:H+ antiporter-2
MTLAELAITAGLLAALGLIANRFGISAIPAYLLAGILLGPNEPTEIVLIKESDVTTFVSELGIIFLLFFLGLEFSVGRLMRSGRHSIVGGTIDLVINWAAGLIVGVAVFGPGLAAFVVAASIHVSSSAIAVKGLIDMRRLGDDETDLVLAILVFEDVVIAFILGVVASGGGSVGTTAGVALTVAAFVGTSLVVATKLAGPIDRLMQRLNTEVMLLAVLAFLAGMAAVAEHLSLSEAVGALMAGVVLSETSMRPEIEERFLSFRDVFAALFFFAFGLSIDLSVLGSVGWLLLGAVAVGVFGKLATGLVAADRTGFTRRQGLNVGCALVAHGEFTIIIAGLAAANTDLTVATRDDITAFAGVYVLFTAFIGIVLMKESKRLGRRLFAVDGGATT